MYGQSTLYLRILEIKRKTKLFCLLVNNNWSLYQTSYVSIILLNGDKEDRNQYILHAICRIEEI